MKISYRLISSVALAVALLVTLAVPAVAGSVPLPSAKGSVGFVLNGRPSKAEFNVKALSAPLPGEEHAPAEGGLVFRYQGLKYEAVLEHIHLHAANEVHFGGKIVKSTNPALVGKFVHVVAVDGGTSGLNGDSISILVTDSDVHQHGALVPVTDGKLAIYLK